MNMYVRMEKTSPTIHTELGWSAIMPKLETPARMQNRDQMVSPELEKSACVPMTGEINATKMRAMMMLRLSVCDGVGNLGGGQTVDKE